MATVRITNASSRTNSLNHAPLPVMLSAPVAGETITSSGTSQPTTISAGSGTLWDIVATGGNVWIMAGATPVAAANTGWLLLDGQRLQLGVTVAAEKIAVINA